MGNSAPKEGNLTPEEIRAWLREIGKPQRWLAESLLVSPGHVRNILCGHDALTARTAAQIRQLMKQIATK